ncbi:protein lin-28 homolog [Sitodiplosis mosellana]|uniref:protein lin-28 homolog n=1 Tax=Sitodiplosis mosellana TaxID=263140 RepID=UPI0024445ACB|nr:protein lin-28 homolog [Sitodiplosis mosellana]
MMDSGKPFVENTRQLLASEGGGECGTESETKTGSDFRRGKCKWFNVSKGWGFITPDDGSQDVFVHQSVLGMTGFRSLGEDEVVDFKSKNTAKGVEATLVTGPDRTNLEGSKIRGSSKKRYRKTRCYNCGQFANHLAADCTLEAQPKKCHYCKSSEHLMANCTQSKNREQQSQSSGS